MKGILLAGGRGTRLSPLTIFYGYGLPDTLQAAATMTKGASDGD